MKKLTLYMASMGTLLSLFSCELMVDVDVPADKPRIVVNAFLTPDSVVRISVTKSRYILDTLDYFDPIETATVRITNENGNTITLTPMGKEWFRSELNPEAGKNYMLSVEAEGFTAVSSSLIIPDVVPILDAKVDSSELKSGVDFPKVQIEITFRDPGDKKNYYEASLYQKVVRQYTNWNQEIIYDTIQGFTPLSQTIETELETDVVSDLLFNGKLYTLKAELNYYGHWGSSTILESKVILRNTSPEYYNYITTMRLQRNTEGDPFAQPVLIYNNIQNGFGIFAGYSQSAKDLLE